VVMEMVPGEFGVGGSWSPAMGSDGYWFNGTLKPHQREGLAWLKGRPRAVLADDVGLGKTIQALALIGQLEEVSGLGRRTPKSVCRVLWVTDSTLLEQTKAEVRRFLPDFTVLTNLDPEFGSALKWRRAFETKFGAGPDILVLSYEMALHRQHWLAHTTPALVVLDEAMKTKGGGKHFRSISEITARTDRVLAMTATPLENNPMELYTLLSVAQIPGLWLKSTFEREFVTWRPGRINQWGEQEKVPDGWQNHKLAEVNAFLSQFMLQRTAESVGLDLPVREPETHRWVALSPAQRDAYDAAAQKFGVGSVGAMETAGKLSGSDSALVDALLKELAVIGDEQAVVYCETLDALDLAAGRLDEAGVAYVRIEGKIKDAERVEAVEMFRQGDVRVLLGSRVLERGLNLQHCRTLISLDASWNPARERQREGRICRIGSPHATFRHLTLLPDTPLTRAKLGKLASKGATARVVAQH
jgi:SNF2 family DNA or RNA helicase